MKKICENCGKEMEQVNGELLCKSCNISKEDGGLKPVIEAAFSFLKTRNWKKADKTSNEALKINKDCSDAYLCKLLAEEKCSSIEDLKRLTFSFDDSKNYKAIMLLDDNKLKDTLKEINAVIIEINSSFGLGPRGNANAEKSARVFSVIAGVFFILFSIAQILLNGRYYIATNFSISLFFIYVLPCFLGFVTFFMLGIFVLRRKRHGIAISWLILSIFELLSWLLYPSFWYLPSILISIAISILYLLFMLLTIFQNKLHKSKFFRLLVFLLPIGYGVLSYLDGAPYTKSKALAFLAMIFYLLYLISQAKNKNRKVEE